jgi:polyisoprenoid-binding protein YceI
VVATGTHRLGPDNATLRVRDAVEVAGDGLSARGDLTMAGATRPVSARLALSPDGHVTGTIPLTQSEWGIKPYRGLMGALRVRDSVEVVLDARLPAA